MSTPPILDITARRPHRADARRNFDAVLAAAKEAFAAHGTDASLEDIDRYFGWVTTVDDAEGMLA